MAVKTLIAVVISLALAGCSEPDCKSACDKLKNECVLDKVVGLDCSAGCADERADCAVCIDDLSCDQIKNGECNTACAQ